jgi:hypothetical protein
MFTHFHCAGMEEDKQKKELGLKSCGAAASAVVAFSEAVVESLARRLNLAP